MRTTRPEDDSRPARVCGARACLGLVIGILVIAGLAGFSAADDDPGKLKVKELPEHWRVWLEEEVYPLITSDQKDAFLHLTTESQRRAFENRLWQLWGKQSGYGARFRIMYGERLKLVREVFQYPTEDRARVLLIQGPPDFELMSQCTEVFHPLVIWGWGYIEGLGQDVVALFYQPDGLGAFRLWNDFDGRQRLYTFMAWEDQLRRNQDAFRQGPESRCANGEQIVALMARAARWSRDPKYLQAMHHLPSLERGGAESSTHRFMEFSALLDEDAVPMDFEVESSERGLQGGKVRMGFDVTVPTSSLGTTTVGDVKVAQVDVVGEISRDEVMLDRFRYLFSVPSAGDELVMLMERYLREGEYTLRLKVEDTHSPHEGVIELPVTVDMDRAETAEKAEVERRKRLVQTLDIDDEINPEEPLLTLVGPQGDAVSGIQRFEAVVRADVSHVTFLVDGQPILTKNRPPFDIDLDLGDLPRLTTVSVIARDAEKKELGRAEIALNVGRERFFLKLKPVSPADVDGDRLRVEVLINTPSDANLERLEVYWNERLLTTMFQEPYEAWVNFKGAGEFGYLRAVALLEDGSQAEDLQFVNAPEFGSAISVTAVELPVTVLDGDGKPVRNLEKSDFRVFEDDVEQEISHFSLQQDIPVRLGIVIDTSGSMERTLPTVQRVVMGFLRHLLRPRDRAYIEAFSDRPDLLAPFTADFDTLENALLALYADRSTALYDASIVGLFQFSGVRGRKAMIVLTDGEDTVSKYSYADVKDYALRAGVTIYTIGIDLPATKITTRYHLKRMAEITGGRAFFLAKKNDLSSIYEQIDEEIRTQYLLAFTSTSTRPPEELREIKVEVDRKGVEVKTISGYYPVGF